MQLRAVLALVVLTMGCDDDPARGRLPTEPDAGTDAAAPATEPPPPFAPAPGATQRLTRARYRNIIADVFGPDVVVPGPLEPDSALDGLVAIGAAQTTISPRGVELYEAAAFAIAEQVVATPQKRAEVLPCEPEGPLDAECLEEVVARLGRRLWRRPLSPEERARLVTVAVEAAASLRDPLQGVVFAIAALLQSPHFIFQPAVGAGRDAARALDDWELAARLAFFLWDAGPDEGLLDAAAEGALSDPDRLPGLVEAMLADPRARRGARAFFADYLHLAVLDGLVKDPLVFTRYSPELGPMAREETLRSIEHLVFEVDGDYRALFTGRTTFLNRKLAALYGVPAPAREGFGRAELPADGPRAGLLGHASVLAGHAHPVSSSATLRGRFIRETLLCGLIPPPPADVDASLPEPSGDLPTLRDRVQEHMTAPACRGCHQIMDPIGLGLENFDGVGRFRETENDVIIDASGDLDGVEFADAIGLGEAIAAHPALGPCLVRNLYSYATGHAPEEREAEALSALHAAFQETGYRVMPLLRALALSPALRTVAAPAEED